MHATLLGLALACAPGLPEAPEAISAPADSVFAIRAATVVVGDGAVLENGTVIVEGSRIRDVGVGLKLPEGTHLIEHDGVLTAGMIAPHSTLIPASERTDSTSPFMESAELVWGFDPKAEACAEAVAAGVTSAVLSPSPSNVVGGITAVAKTHGGTILSREGHLALSMNASATSFSRYPTSYSGVVAELDARLGDGATGVYSRASAGSLPVLIAADSPSEAQRAMALARRHGLRGALLGARRVGEDQLEVLRASGLAVVFNTFDPGLGQRSINAMVEVANAGLPFAFALTDADDVRFAAASLVRAGVGSEVVWNALTAGAASIAGVDARVGTLRRGMDADLCLWSGHPLDLTSELQAVYVDGVHVDHARSEGNDQ